MSIPFFTTGRLAEDSDPRFLGATVSSDHALLYGNNVAQHLHGGSPPLGLGLDPKVATQRRLDVDTGRLWIWLNGTWR